MSASNVIRGSQDISSLLEAMAATPGLLEAAVKETSDSMLDFAPPGEWSARTVLAHLRDDEFMVMRMRLVRITVEDHPRLASFNAEGWANSRWKGRDSKADLLADFRLQREASMMVLRRLGGEDWQRTADHPEFKVFDAHWWLEHWVEHDRDHLAQIKDTLAQAGG